MLYFRINSFIDGWSRFVGATCSRPVTGCGARWRGRPICGIRPKLCKVVIERRSSSTPTISLLILPLVGHITQHQDHQPSPAYTMNQPTPAYTMHQPTPAYTMHQPTPCTSRAPEKNKLSGSRIFPNQNCLMKCVSCNFGKMRQMRVFFMFLANFVIIGQFVQ